MTDFNDFLPSGEAAPDRWVAATHLFDGVAPGGVPAPREEGPFERWERANARFDARDYIGAANLLAAIVAEDPGPTGPRLLLARAYYHSAQLRRAEEQLREVIDRDPVEHYAHLLLARTLERQGRHDEAASWKRMAAAFGVTAAE
ncbi:tetratricopeptide repeat protein [Glycomyces terrestris]|uniref:Tetratricopeptide repeat protein n=1 Tax=Glycomyces terrestris TaxID=2493553 RepID=A0A426V4S3_9ACTN|nr:tetratricopeptide repeat protein [Glycomyces terrestris]RRS01818.1 tetratricopeptide repeat protein [Glycomyces terrestris]